MLYDDSEQLEVRHVISLAHHDVEIYAGGQPVPEGELWIKRNCIRLSPRPSLAKNGEAKPFFFFSDNCSEKEDFYHALLQSQEWRAETSPKAPLPQKFDTPDLVKLVQQLHATEENLNTRWINALIGRLFLALYKTQDVDRMIWTKISKKIARVPKPALISGINVQRIDMGHLPPFITNPKLRELTVDGDLTIEADVSYKGNFRLDISALARIDLGTRFKAREVTFVLATILRKLEGHILIRIKPPPSNRLWVTFETAPKMIFSLEPIVSSRQITYGVILRAIESRIREVVNETLVLPNWDDIPFTSTESRAYRGGLWEETKTTDSGSDLNIDLDQNGETIDATDLQFSVQESEHSEVSSIETTKSAPVQSSIDTLHSRKSRTSVPTQTNEDVAISSSTDHRSHSKPKAMRSTSFASVASPVISENPAIPRNEGRTLQDDAVTSMKTTISKSPPHSPDATSAEPMAQFEATATQSSTITPSPDLSATSIKSFDAETSSGFDLANERLSIPETNASLTESGTLPSEDMPSTPSQIGAQSLNRQSTINSSLVSATAAAKKWISARQASNAREPTTNPPSSQTSMDDAKIPPKTPKTPKTPNKQQEELHSPSIPYPDPKLSPVVTVDGSPRPEPFGRGQPLPPPGTPLPRPPKPERRTWNVPVASAIANFGRRKTVPAKSPVAGTAGTTATNSSSSSNVDLQGGQPPSTPSRVADASNSSNSSGLPKTLEKTNTGSGGALNSSPALVTRKRSDSPPPPPLPRRRQRLSVAETKNVPVDSELFVVAAPELESSAPTSPIAPDAFAEQDGSREGVGIEERTADTTLEDATARKLD